MVDHLNPLIRGRGYRSHSEVRLGTQVAVDVGAFEREPPNFDPYGMPGEGGVATEAYAPPKTDFAAEVSFASADLFEVKIYRGTWSLVAESNWSALRTRIAPTRGAPLRPSVPRSFRKASRSSWSMW